MRYIVKAQLLESFSGVHKSLHSLFIAGAAGTAFERLVPFDEPDEHLFGLLVSWFLFLNKTPMPNILILYGLLVQTLSRIGYQLRLDGCSRCGKGQKELLTTPFFFSPKDGGLICHTCFQKEKGTGAETPVGLPEVSDLTLLLTAKWQLLQKTERADKEKARLGTLLFAFAAYHAPRPLPSLSKVAKLLKSA